MFSVLKLLPTIGHLSRNYSRLPSKKPHLCLTSCYEQLGKAQNRPQAELLINKKRECAPLKDTRLSAVELIVRSADKARKMKVRASAPLVHLLPKPKSPLGGTTEGYLAKGKPIIRAHHILPDLAIEPHKEVPCSKNSDNNMSALCQLYKLKDTFCPGAIRAIAPLAALLPRSKPPPVIQAHHTLPALAVKPQKKTPQLTYPVSKWTPGTSFSHRTLPTLAIEAYKEIPPRKYAASKQSALSKVYKLKNTFRPGEVRAVASKKVSLATHTPPVIRANRPVPALAIEPQKDIPCRKYPPSKHSALGKLYKLCMVKDTLGGRTGKF